MVVLSTIFILFRDVTVAVCTNILEMEIPHFMYIRYCIVAIILRQICQKIIKKGVGNPFSSLFVITRLTFRDGCVL